MRQNLSIEALQITVPGVALATGVASASVAIVTGEKSNAKY